MSMKNVGDLMKRLQKMMPAHIEPAFKTGEELLAWQKEQGRLRSEALERENRAMKMQRTFNRSGIRPLHQNCSFDNYRVECEGQMNALARARRMWKSSMAISPALSSPVNRGPAKITWRQPSATSCCCAEVGLNHHRGRYYVGDERYLWQPGNERRAVTERPQQSRPVSD